MSPRTYIAQAQADPKKIKALDLDGEFSFGKDAKSFMMAPRTGQRWGAVLQNHTEEEMLVVVGGVMLDQLSNDSNNLIETIAGIKDFNLLGTDTTDEEDDRQLFKATAKYPNFPIELFNYNTFNSPIQLTSIQMKSTSLAAATMGQQESTNFSGRIVSYFKQAYGAEPVREEVLFELYQDAKDVQEGLLRIDLVKEQKNIIFGNESVVYITLQPKTQLNVDFEFGAQASAHQRLYRGIKRSFENLADWYAKTCK